MKKAIVLSLIVAFVASCGGNKNSDYSDVRIIMPLKQKPREKMRRQVKILHMTHIGVRVNLIKLT